MEIKANHIYNADCLEVMKYIATGSVDMILCDLPQEITANAWDKKLPLQELWSEYHRIIKDNGAIVLFSNGMLTAELMMSNPKMWRYNLVWEKSQPVGFFNARKMPLRAHEDICVFYKKLPTYNPQKTTGHVRKISKASHKINCKKSTNYGDCGLSSYDSTERFPRSVLRFPTDKQTCSIHPTQKPVALCEYFIRTFTSEGDTVLDNCAGSATTPVACINTGRNYIAIEKDPDIYKSAVERIERVTEEVKTA